jgi:multidrug efflux pump subunit AcrB
VFFRFFINRPILALALLAGIGLAAVTAFLALAVWQYLQKPLPTVQVSATYPGANAQMVADTVAVPIEQEVGGVEDMVSMSRECTDNGDYRLTVTFRRGTDINIAQVLVQNRVSMAYPRLPEQVKLTGVTVTRQPTR